MRHQQLLHVGLTIVLVISLISNLAFWIELQGLRRSFEAAWESYDRNYEDYLAIFLSPLSVSTPIPMSEAMNIALRQGAWNETSLRDVEVDVSLCYMRFNTTDGSFELLYEVTQPVSNYNQTRSDKVTYKYVWRVIVHRKDHELSIPPLGFYLVDAVTGEIIPVFIM